MERCWVICQLSWGLGLFYLNCYLTLLGYISIMLWLTSNPNKTEVGILLLTSPSPEARWKDTDAHLRCWYSSMSNPQNGTEIWRYLVSSCDLEWFEEYLTIIIQVVIACQLIFFVKSFRTVLILFFSQHRYVNYADVRLIWPEPKGAWLLYCHCTCCCSCGLCESQSERESVPSLTSHYWCHGT